VNDARDLVRYLPLSARAPVDESAVTGDWAGKLAGVRDQLAALVAGLSPAERAPVESLLAHADSLQPTGRKVRVTTLGAVLADACEVAAILQKPLPIDPVASGAVVLAQSLRAPLAIRAVVRGRTLRANDADWRIGSGPDLIGSARDLVLFVYGRRGLPGS